MKKPCITALAFSMILSSATVNVQAKSNSETNNKDIEIYCVEKEPEIYVDGNLYNDFNGQISLRTRSSCFDLYSADFCHAHGYYNNRPMAPTNNIVLTDKESQCLLKLYGDLAIAAAKGLIKIDPWGMAKGAAEDVYKWWVCRS